MVGVDGCQGALFRIYRYVRGGFCKVGRRRVSVGREIEVEECEVGICEGVRYEGTPSRPKSICCMRAPGRGMGVEVSHEGVVTMPVEKKIKSGHEIGRTGGVRGM